MPDPTTMPAGRELDAAVAEALGWKWVPTTCWNEPRMLVSPQEAAEFIRLATGVERIDEQVSYCRVPAYSTDAGAAIQALSELAAKELSCVLAFGSGVYTECIIAAPCGPSGEAGPSCRFTTDGVTPQSFALATSRAIVAAHAAGLLGEKKEVNQNGL